MPSAPTCLAEANNKLTPGGLRHRRGLSQTTLAGLLKVSQPYIAQIESQGDMHLATLRRHLEALGGEFAPFARFPDNSEEIALPGPDDQ